MGLDMYLMAEKTLSSSSAKDKKLIEFLKSNEIVHEDSEWHYIPHYSGIRSQLSDFKLTGQVGLIDYFKSENNQWSIRTEACYWRKANHIHNWFVLNVQNRVDDCSTYEVSNSQLAELLLTIDAVDTRHARAQHLLPTSSGFFFGSTEYNESYYRDLKSTKKIITQCLKPSTTKHWKFYYSSSW